MRVVRAHSGCLCSPLCLYGCTPASTLWSLPKADNNRFEMYISFTTRVRYSIHIMDDATPIHLLILDGIQTETQIYLNSFTLGTNLLQTLRVNFTSYNSTTDPYYQDPARCNPESSPDFPMDSNNLHCRGPNGDRCRCKPVKMCQKTYLRNNYNYVIRARVREVRNRGMEPTAVVDVKEVLKSSLVNIPKDTQTLYYSSSCLCPPLSPGEEYIIMGYESEETSRLLLIDSSIAQKWKDRMSKKVKKWNAVQRDGPRTHHVKRH